MSLFTIEQLELIRRLRSTGITAEAVLEAFRTLEQIEADLDATRIQSAALAALMTPSKLFNAPDGATGTPTSTSHGSSVDDGRTEVSPCAMSDAGGTPSLALEGTSNTLFFQRMTNQSFTTTVPAVSISAPSRTSVADSPVARSPDDRHSAALLPVSSSVGPQNSPSASLLPSSLGGGIPFPAPLAIPSSCGVYLGSSSSSSGGATSSSRSMRSAQSSPPSTSTSSCRPIRSQRTPMKEITTLDDPSELDDFLSQGEESCISDMKQFITQFSLRQTTVAMMTGVSQPYISKLLNGNHRELSLRCRKNIYSWYLNCRRHPEKLASFLQDPSTRLETNNEGELVPQRRERYVFRPILIKILEAFFLEAPFPDTAKRAEIAAACNQALQADKKGAQLMPKEVVTPQVIANWFANKRKEMRRRSNEDSPSNQGASGSGTSAGGRNLASFSETGSTPSPQTDSNGQTPMDIAMDVDTLQRSAADDFLDARPVIHVPHMFQSSDGTNSSSPQMSPEMAISLSLKNIFGSAMPIATSTTTTESSSSSCSPSSHSVPNSGNALTGQDLIESLTQSGVFNFINSFYSNAISQPIKLEAVE